MTTEISSGWKRSPTPLALTSAFLSAVSAMMFLPVRDWLDDYQMSLVFVGIVLIAVVIIGFVAVIIGLWAVRRARPLHDHVVSSAVSTVAIVVATLVTVLAIRSLYILLIIVFVGQAMGGSLH